MAKLDKQKLYDAYHNVITGNQQSRITRTKPTHRTDQAERDVQRECLRWLRVRNCVADRNNVGSGDLSGRGAFFSYGIKGGGDIFAILPPHGKHVEIECKSGKGGEWSEDQQKRARRVKSVGGIYIVVHSVQELARHIEPLLPGLFIEESNENEE